jgi:hypothetical protein
VWITKHWRAAVGVGLAVESIWKGIKWILDWLGRVDFVVAHLRDIGVVSVLDFLIDPPAWTVWPTVAAAAFFIWSVKSNLPVHGI